MLEQSQPAAKHLVCHISELKQVGSRKTIIVEDRSILILRLQHQIVAIDSYCYHAGGPLQQGDIEDLGNGHICIVCPWYVNYLFYFLRKAPLSHFAYHGRKLLQGF